MAAVFEFEHIVAAEEIDGWGHVNNLSYLRWMLQAAMAHSDAQGWPARRYMELGAGWVVRSHYIEYLRPAFLGDGIVVRTWVSSFQRITSIRKYKIVRRHDTVVLAAAETNWAFVGLQQLSPRRIPPEVYDSFVLVPADQEP